MNNFVTNLNRKILIISIILFALCFLLGFISKRNFISPLTDYETRIHFINVGQGDCILIENNNFNILIDSGPNTASDKVISYLKKYKIKNLDYVISTHPHEDHIGSMDDIINKFNISKFIMTKATSTEIDFSNMIKMLKSKNIFVETPNNNTTIQLSPDNSLSFLWTRDTSDENLNNSSMVVKYTNKNISLLLTGDIEEPIESSLLSQNAPIDSTILKVGHHGSNTSSSKEFLRNVSPAISVISCGMGNDFGHPSKTTLKSLHEVNSKILRTDINGHIIIKTNGDSLMINTENNDN